MAEQVASSSADRLGRAIHLRRVELNLKRPELARRAELSYPYVSEIENGMKTPSTKALRPGRARNCLLWYVRRWSRPCANGESSPCWRLGGLSLRHGN